MSNIELLQFLTQDNMTQITTFVVTIVSFEERKYTLCNVHDLT